jgi:hypothetical protein
MSTDEEIRRIVRERIEDAKRKQIREKALEILYTLGRYTLFSLLTLGFTRIYCDNKIKIKGGYLSNYLQIKARQENSKFKLVFYMKNEYDLYGSSYYTLHNIKCYIPGEWENHLENLWYEAEQRKLKVKEKELNKLKENFGIQ